jgi:hypothetical protein
MTILLRSWNRGWCNELYTAAHERWQDLYVPHPIEHHNDPTFNKHVDESRFRELDVGVKALDEIKTGAQSLIGYDSKMISVGVVRWDEGTFMKSHRDNPPGWEDRDIALIVYLNQDFAGGHFMGLGYNHQPGQGDVIYFDCTDPDTGEGAMHGVSKITQGVRYTFNCWFSQNSC